MVLQPQIIEKQDLVHGKGNRAAVVQDLTRERADIEACRRMIAQIFSREKMSVACGAGEAVLMDFLGGCLGSILDDNLSTVAIGVGSGKPVSFCIQVALDAVDSEDDAPLPEQLKPVFDLTHAMQWSFFEYLEYLSLVPTHSVPGVIAGEMRFAGVEEARNILDAYIEGTCVHALMAGRVFDENWRGVTSGVVKAAFRKAWRAGKRYVIAETTSPHSTSILLGLGGKIMLTVPYQKAGSPLNTIPVCDDWHEDVKRNQDGTPKYSYCRQVLLDLGALARDQKWV